MKREKSVADLFREKIESNPVLMKVVTQDRRRVYVAEQIRALRKAAALSQKELADRIGTAQSAVSRIESADYKGHAHTTLEKIADALGVDLWVVFGPKPRRLTTTKSRARPKAGTTTNGR